MKKNNNKLYHLSITDSNEIFSFDFEDPYEAIAEMYIRFSLGEKLYKSKEQSVIDAIERTRKQTIEYIETNGTIMKGIFEDINLREMFCLSKKTTPEDIAACYDDKSLYDNIEYRNGQFVERDYNLKRKRWYK